MAKTSKPTDEITIFTKQAEWRSEITAAIRQAVVGMDREALKRRISSGKKPPNGAG